MSNVYILGSTGFVGSHLVEFLGKKNSYNIVTAGRTDCDIPAELGYDCDALIKSVNEGDYVVFLASISSPDFCRDNEIIARQVNVTGTIDLLYELENKGVRTIFASSDAVYGGSSGLNDDYSEVAPFGHYGSMKAEVEAYIQNSCSHAVIARFSYVFDKTDRFTQSLIESEKKHNVMSIFEGFVRNVVSLDDVLQGLYNMICYWDPVKFKIVNFCGPETISRYELASIVRREYLPKLQFSLDNAPESFWLSRPRAIQLKSTLFPQLIGRKQKTIEESIKSWS